ncbi:MoaD/ThiS family protein [Vulcanisaeta sp. JCM 16161]|uniref:MoaD/ThiS family protein n=1 Tax=Vulcanisaeta sp. JCM 16161 TaxID=1295372 RepID=UPI0006D03A77|nr:MoaD/ThiS family protein [Vulcanisaeta sp. JCM 16161]
MKVKVILSANLHELANAVSITLQVPDGCTVKDLIMRLGEVNPEIPKILLKGDELNENYVVIVNGRDIYWLKGLFTNLSDGDEVLIAPKAFIS